MVKGWRKPLALVVDLLCHRRGIPYRPRKVDATAYLHIFLILYRVSVALVEISTHFYVSRLLDSLPPGLLLSTRIVAYERNTYAPVPPLYSMLQLP